MDNREDVARRALASAREGFGRTPADAKRVVVIGAGMVGLAAASS